MLSFNDRCIVHEEKKTLPLSKNNFPLNFISIYGKRM